MNQATGKPSTWRVVLAAIFDVLTAFLVLGFVIGWLTGGLTENGFSLQGLSALLLFAAVVAYFVIFNRFLGGTIWKRVFGAVRPRESISDAGMRDRA